MAGTPTWLVVLPESTALTAMHDEDFLDITQAQQALLPNTRLMAVEHTLQDGEIAAIEQRSGVKVHQHSVNAWRSAEGAWFFVEQLCEQNAVIVWALALDASGQPIGIEVLRYEVRYGNAGGAHHPQPRQTGRRKKKEAIRDQHISHIPGAHSSEPMSHDLRRLIATHALVLAHC